MIALRVLSYKNLITIVHYNPKEINGSDVKFALQKIILYFLKRKQDIFHESLMIMLMEFGARVYSVASITK